MREGERKRELAVEEDIERLRVRERGSGRVGESWREREMKSGREREIGRENESWKERRRQNGRQRE